MHWHSEFQSEFFGTWVQEGLAHPEKYESQYTAELKSNRYCGENPVKHSHAHHPLRQEILDSVYGFGFMVGKTCAE
ncbi:MAG: hypothetical protein ACE5I1_09370, partial [bacterium]